MQQTQIPLVCATSNMRPRVVTDMMRFDAALRVAEDLAKFGHIPHVDIMDAVKDILFVTRRHTPMDGYEIARDLEKHKHWTCNFEMSEILDFFSGTCICLLGEAVQKWGFENPMDPPFQVGFTVNTPHGVGTIIAAPCSHGANSFLVRVNGNDLLIPFEDARAIEPHEGVSVVHGIAP